MTGAGIVGSMSCYLLARSGLSVAILDADAVGSHALGFAFGGLDPLHGMGLPEPLLDFSLYSFGRHSAMAQELADATGIDPRYQRRNRLYLAFDDADVGQYQANLSRMRDVAMFEIQWVDGDAARQLEPQVNPACVVALYQQGAASVDACRLTLAAGSSTGGALDGRPSPAIRICWIVSRLGSGCVSYR